MPILIVARDLRGKRMVGKLKKSLKLTKKALSMAVTPLGFALLPFVHKKILPVIHNKLIIN